MLLQIDGSRHNWLGERGPWLTLIAAIDDATGKISAAIFREQEDAQGYFLLVRQLVERYGCPLALYHDRHSIFTQSCKATEADTLQEQLAGTQEPTQFGRLLQELAITSIAARSPQAKGRVERLFGTLQDRLVVELREASASTLEQANAVVQAYLPRFISQSMRRRSFVSSICARWRWTTRSVWESSVCNCCRAKSATAMPARRSRCMSASMAVSRSTMGTTVSRPHLPFRRPQCCEHGKGVEPLLKPLRFKWRGPLMRRLASPLPQESENRPPTHERVRPHIIPGVNPCFHESRGDDKVTEHLGRHFH